MRVYSSVCNSRDLCKDPRIIIFGTYVEDGSILRKDMFEQNKEIRDKFKSIQSFAGSFGPVRCCGDGKKNTYTRVVNTD